MEELEGHLNNERLEERTPEEISSLREAREWGRNQVNFFMQIAQQKGYSRFQKLKEALSEVTGVVRN